MGMPDIVKGGVPSTLRKVNIRNVIDVIRSVGACSRAELTKYCKVSAPTMSKLLDDLLVAGFIEEESRDPVGKGRPSKVYRLITAQLKVIAVVIRINDYQITTGGLDGVIDKKNTRIQPIPDNYGKLLKEITAYVNDILGSRDVKCLGIGLCLSGLIDKDSNVVLSPNQHLLDGHNPQEDIASLTGIDTVTLHDPNALCLAEQYIDKSLAKDDFVVVNLSAGVGMGVFNSGKHVKWGNGFGAEIGHIPVKPDGPLCGCGKRGCLETLAGDSVLTRDLSEKYDRVMSMIEVIDLVKSGKINIEEELKGNLEYISNGLSIAINLFSPSRVYIHGKIFDVQDGLFERLIQLTSEKALDPSLKLCKILRARGNKLQGTVIGVNNHVFESIGPKIV